MEVVTTSTAYLVKNIRLKVEVDVVQIIPIFLYAVRFFDLTCSRAMRFLRFANNISIIAIVIAMVEDILGKCCDNCLYPQQAINRHHCPDCGTGIHILCCEDWKIQPRGDDEYPCIVCFEKSLSSTGELKGSVAGNFFDCSIVSKKLPATKPFNSPVNDSDESYSYFDPCSQDRDEEYMFEPSKIS